VLGAQSMIRAQLSDGFESAHALIVRPLGDGWQIVSGHQRVEAPRRAVLEVPCWVRGFDDEAAYILLVTSNFQGEQSARSSATSKLTIRA
jgi:ParB-like chromosome segregation protein Spo0J